MKFQSDPAGLDRRTADALHCCRDLFAEAQRTLTITIHGDLPTVVDTVRQHYASVRTVLSSPLALDALGMFAIQQCRAGDTLAPHQARDALLDPQQRHTAGTGCVHVLLLALNLAERRARGLLDVTPASTLLN
ncbi:hypothetical protein [Paraburkholderia saeva]|uniref:Uncharacterized protein n=1 Tax=Paraburkholderia saeva TaxID=2777537 RepID=A0A9N8X2N5_9BURK|nr:hypothetical protein [Paraburkholderia saeva]CAG4903106.1 hypothetical protein LMG31841_03187 [Paraburkholderia saeva]